MSMRTLYLAVTGLFLAVAACSSDGTSVLPIERTPVASVSITLPSPSLVVGQRAHGTATALDASGTVLTGRTITWKTSSASVASVDDSGMIAGVAPGTAMISAASEGVTGQADLDVVEPSPAPVASVSVALASGSLNPGQTTQATATARDANNNVLSGRSIAWSSSNTAVASVAAAGVVTAVGVGTAQITATSEGQNGSASLSVVSTPPVPVASVNVSLANSSRTPGQTTQATATARDANNNVLTGRSIAWSSSNTAIATVSGSGLVTAIAAGTAQITATSEGKSGSALLTVAVPPPVPVASVTVSLAASSLNPGLTTQATATPRDANNNVLTGRSIAWSSSNTAVATVSGSGLVSAIAAGTAQITATSEGQSGSAPLTVAVPPPVPVASVSVSLAAGSLNPGQTTQATATPRDANNNVLTGRVITWSSSNPGVATVSPSGLVTALAVGAVQILASCEARSGNANLDVLNPPPPGSSNEPSGMKLITERPFDAISELGWIDNEGIANSHGKIISDPTAPKSPSGVLQITLPAGFGEGGGPWSGDYVFPVNYRTLYVSYWAKYSSNWYGPTSNINKTFYLYTSLGSPSLVFDMDCNGNGPMITQVAGQDILAGGGTVGGDPANPFWTPNLASGNVPRGQWHHVEFVVVGNSAGNKDGSIDWYLNGVHVGSYKGIQFQSGNTDWNWMHYTLLYTGARSSNPPTDQYNYWDHLYISGK